MPTSLQLTTRSSFLTQDFQQSIRRIHPLGHYKSSKLSTVLYYHFLLCKEKQVLLSRKKITSFWKAFEVHFSSPISRRFHFFGSSKAPLLHISTTTIISFFSAQKTIPVWNVLRFFFAVAPPRVDAVSNMGIFLRCWLISTNLGFLSRDERRFLYALWMRLLSSIHFYQYMCVVGVLWQ